MGTKELIILPNTVSEALDAYERAQKKHRLKERRDALEREIRKEHNITSEQIPPEFQTLQYKQLQWQVEGWNIAAVDLLEDVLRARKVSRRILVEC